MKRLAFHCGGQIWSSKFRKYDLQDGLRLGALDNVNAKIGDEKMAMSMSSAFVFWAVVNAAVVKNCIDLNELYGVFNDYSGIVLAFFLTFVGHSADKFCLWQQQICIREWLYYVSM